MQNQHFCSWTASWPQDGPNMGPRWIQEGPWSQRCPRWPQDAVQAQTCRVYAYLCMCIYMHVCLYIYIYIYMEIYIYTHTYIYICIYTHMYMHIYRHIFFSPMLRRCNRATRNRGTTMKVCAPSVFYYLHPSTIIFIIIL